MRFIRHQNTPAPPPPPPPPAMDADDFVFEDLTSDEEGSPPEIPSAGAAHSPWDFAGYTESVADEHARRSTTSIDDKISRARQRRPLTLPIDEEPESADRQEAYLPEAGDGEVAAGEGDRKNAFFGSSEGASFQADSFLGFHLCRALLRACDALGYKKPTPIQAACVPLALLGRDICGSAITGSGKTAAFALPVLDRLVHRPKGILATRALILTPTRELAVQVHSMIEKLAQFTDVRCALVVGGLSLKIQEAALRSRPDVVVATPGRLIDHLRNSQSVGLEDLTVLILDEADRLLEVGFSAEIHELIQLCPKRRQTMLFSATMTEEVDALVKLSLNKPVRLSADPLTKRPATLTEEVVRIRRSREANQEAVLLTLCSKTFNKKVIIFSGTKQAAHRLKILFGLAGLNAAELHGNLTQVQRLDALELFRKQEVDFLVATDVAARGLDIIGVETVINFACPRDITSYVHRVGRTARAGREGYAVTFVTDNDYSLLKAIAKRAGSKLKSRIVAEQSISKWSQAIEQMEDQISSILREEKEERELRKAEMEAEKAENLIEHKEEIFSRPKRTWFATEKEKKLLAKAVKESNFKNSGANQIISAEKAEELKRKEKIQREHEKNLPRKKRRRLEAAREMAEDEDIEEGEQHGEAISKKGKSLVELGYQRAKAAKAVTKAKDSGKFTKKSSKAGKHAPKRSHSDEMKELFKTDMSEASQRRAFSKNKSVGSMKKSKNSFKSKSRYKRKK